MKNTKTENYTNYSNIFKTMPPHTPTFPVPRGKQHEFQCFFSFFFAVFIFIIYDMHFITKM